jgi:uncharacterized membrane protein
MTYDWILFAVLFLALWSAIVGGIFWAFSDFIMKALVRAEPASGIEAMQQINKTVIGTQFVAGILLIPVLSIALAVYAWGSMTGLPLFALLLAAVVFVPSVFLMTLAGNVPMNNRLAALDHTSEEGTAYWALYGRRWTRLNHVRSFGSVATAVIYLVAAVALMHTGRV